MTLNEVQCSSPIASWFHEVPSRGAESSADIKVSLKPAPREQSLLTKPEFMQLKASMVGPGSVRKPFFFFSERVSATESGEVVHAYFYIQHVHSRHDMS